MQKVELQNRIDLEIFCPFCGLRVQSDEGLKTCEHVLYHASDSGFEYVKAGIGFDADVDLDELSMDEYTDALEFENSFKIAVYNPPPSFFGGYVAFQKD
jgi:hypothetical protein